MDIVAILLLLILVIVVAGFILRPFRDGGPEVWEEDIELSELQAERERILDALVELEFDNDLGKVPEEIYEPQRRSLLAKGAEVIKQLEDEYQIGAGADRLEDQIAERKRRAAELVGEDDDLEKLIRQRRASGAQPGAKRPQKTAKAKYCPKCGQLIEPGDRFCTACGTKI